MFCAKCRNELPRNAVFCPFCGAETSNAIAPAKLTKDDMGEEIFYSNVWWLYRDKNSNEQHKTGILYLMKKGLFFSSSFGWTKFAVPIEDIAGVSVCPSMKGVPPLNRKIEIALKDGVKHSFIVYLISKQKWINLITQRIGVPSESMDTPAKMMVCPSCGRQYPSDQVYCDDCGALLKEAKGR